MAAYFSTKPDVPHMWGFQYLFSEWEMGDEFFWQCKKACQSHCYVASTKYFPNQVYDDVPISVYCTTRAGRGGTDVLIYKYAEYERQYVTESYSGLHF